MGERKEGIKDKKLLELVELIVIGVGNGSEGVSDTAAFLDVPTGDEGPGSEWSSDASPESLSLSFLPLVSISCRVLCSSSLSSSGIS